MEIWPTPSPPSPMPQSSPSPRRTDTTASRPSTASSQTAETWTALHWPGERDWAFAIAVDPRDDRSVWIGLAHSTDGGVTWTIEPSNTPVSMLSVAFNRDGTVLYGLSRDYKGVEGNARQSPSRYQ